MVALYAGAAGLIQEHAAEPRAAAHGRGRADGLDGRGLPRSCSSSSSGSPGRRSWARWRPGSRRWRPSSPQATQDRAEAATLLAEHKRLVAEARHRRHGIVAEARGVAEKERALAMEKTKQEQEELLARARREIAAERDRAVADLRREAVDLSLAAASKLVGKRLDTETDRRIVSEYLADAGRSGVRPVTIARNYAEALFDLGEQSGQTDALRPADRRRSRGGRDQPGGAGDSHVAPGAQGGEGAAPGRGAAATPRGTSCSSCRRW